MGQVYRRYIVGTRVQIQLEDSPKSLDKRVRVIIIHYINGRDFPGDPTTRNAFRSIAGWQVDDLGDSQRSNKGDSPLFSARSLRLAKQQSILTVYRNVSSVI